MTVTHILDEPFAAHKRHDFGTTGLRRVVIDVWNAEKVAVSYNVDHLWRRDGDVCRSLMFLSSPRGIAGTAILLSERQGLFEVDIWLKLSTAKRSVSVSTGRILQNVLGTDFSYEDLRFWYPTDVIDVIGVDEVISNDERLNRVRAWRSMPDGKKVAVELWLRDDGGLVVSRRDLTENPHGERLLQATGWCSDHSRSYPTEISIERRPGRYISSITLTEIRLDLTVPASIFEVDVLNTLTTKASLDSLL